MTMLTPPLGLQNAGATHTAAQLRTYLASLQAGNASSATALLSRGGVHPTLGSSFQVTQAGSPNMTVLVGSGVCSIPGSESATQGNYFACNDAQATLVVTAAHATLARIDLVVVNVRDSFYSGANNDVQLQVVAGTPASSPVAPTAPNNSITIAQIAVGAAVSSITNGNITDTRTYMAATGGVLNVATEAGRPTTSSIDEGQLVWTMDTNKLWVHNGTSYVQMYPNSLGVIARGNRTSDKTYSGTEVGVLRLDDIPLLAGRAYAITTSSLRLQLATAGNTALTQLRYTTDGSTPDPTASTILQAADVNADSAFMPANNATLTGYYFPVSDTTFSVVLTLSRSGGAGNITMSGSATRPIDLMIIDLGPAPSDTGTDI